MGKIKELVTELDYLGAEKYLKDLKIKLKQNKQNKKRSKKCELL